MPTTNNGRGDSNGRSRAAQRRLRSALRKSAAKTAPGSENNDTVTMMSDWPDIPAVLVICLCGLASAYLIVFGMHLYLLLYLSHRRRDAVRSAQRVRIETYQKQTPADAFPLVTTQIPL